MTGETQRRCSGENVKKKILYLKNLKCHVLLWFCEHMVKHNLLLLPAEALGMKTPSNILF